MPGIFCNGPLNSQFLVHSRIPKGTKADIVWRETGDTAMIPIIFLASGQVMLMHSICTDNGQHSELMKTITDKG